MARPDRAPVPDRILRWLAAGPMTRAQLKRRLGREPSAALRDLLRTGQITTKANDTDAMTEAQLYVRVR